MVIEVSLFVFQTFRHVMGQLLGQFQPWTRLPPSHMCGWVLLGASLEEGVGQTYRLVVEVKGDRQGQKLKVWLECEGIVTAPVETRRGKEWYGLCVCVCVCAYLCIKAVSAS